MRERNYEYLIIGQGIAGTTLAWELYWLGVPFLLIDRGEETTTSKVAAGLITPVTGQRLVPSWNFLELRPVAERFYRWVESETGTACFRSLGMLRIFQNEKEKELFGKKKEALKLFVSEELPVSQIGNENFKAPRGGFEMPDAGQLQTKKYLEASREFFRFRGLLVEAEINPEQEVQFEKQEKVVLPRLDLVADHLVLCQGVETFRTSWFRGLPAQPAKGEILTIRVPGLYEDRVVNSGLWMVPEGNQVFRVGSTYEWKQLDQVPTAAGREQICRRLKRFLKLPFEVLSHSAAVRPGMEDQKPVLGRHPEISRLCLFNGLGSKGSLMAPFFAKELVDYLVRGEPLDPEVDVQAKMWKAGNGKK